MINVTSCVQSAIHLQPHTLEVSFATLQMLYQLCAGQACPIPQQSGVVDPSVKVNGQYYQDIIAYERSSARYYAVLGLLHISAGQSPSP